MSTTDLTIWTRLVVRTVAHNAQPQEMQAWMDEALIILVSTTTKPPNTLTTMDTV